MALYPFCYYVGVGLVLRVVLILGAPAVLALLLERLASGLICVAFVGISALFLAKRFMYSVVLGIVAILTTPMSLFLFNSINPNGFEIATCVAMATTVVSIRYDKFKGELLSRPLLAFF